MEVEYDMTDNMWLLCKLELGVLRYVVALVVLLEGLSSLKSFCLTPIYRMVFHGTRPEGVARILTLRHPPLCSSA